MYVHYMYMCVTVCVIHVCIDHNGKVLKEEECYIVQQQSTLPSSNWIKIIMIQVTIQTIIISYINIGTYMYCTCTVHAHSGAC